ncbi:3-hydroxyacyl-ACP dehydratase FabZ [Amylibacter sp. IMCC11727]|uniref:3-hydroxyacyl-ACP dehydratase FabZ n=1 Tax=Amylibacter sp. IMCC11727 TaxID=3039851 RepID=UPI00244D9B6F|nr:3-hydroxyacyl-ACP dehydratase FabZ [Amylibacter sp. IMCC11727]WGI20686.1 3-hydroxyacyl-ACP dehydratase FabZ [Amylibacter sp. IMCC11727]
MADADAGGALLSADIQDIKRMIPHRYPFLLIDRVRDIDLNKSAVGIKNVTYNEPHFQGHFPAQPIMPGVTIVEAMAQTAAVLVVKTLDMMDNDMLVYFLSIDKCKFRHPVTPGDQLELHVKVIRGRGKLWRFFGEGVVDGKVVAEAEFNAMMVPPEDQ